MSDDGVDDDRVIQYYFDFGSCEPEVLEELLKFIDKEITGIKKIILA